MKYLALILALTPFAASPQSLTEQLAQRPSISFADWRELTAGKTVVYQIDGETYGFERYVAPGKVKIQLTDGTCIDGTWYMEDANFCFDWQDETLNCFHHKKLGGEIYVIGLENGVETDDIQRVSRIANIPLSCGPALLSALETSP